MVGCETAPESPAVMRDQALSSLDQMEARDSTLKYVLDNAYGYVIFPEIGEAAIGVGGAGGTGIVYQQGRRIGTVTLKQASLGLQLGGQTYAELVIFQDEKAFNRLQNDSVEFGADASAALIKAGAAKSGNFANGVQVYILPRGGLMAGISLNGQKFHFVPATQAVSNP